jgi:hypothetical protein
MSALKIGILNYASYRCVELCVVSPFQIVSGAATLGRIQPLFGGRGEGRRIFANTEDDKGFRNSWGWKSNCGKSHGVFKNFTADFCICYIFAEYLPVWRLLLCLQQEVSWFAQCVVSALAETPYTKEFYKYRLFFLDRLQVDEVRNRKRVHANCPRFFFVCSL